MKEEDIELLLWLNGDRYQIDKDLGLWVKYDVKLVMPSIQRPHGIKYSISLHDVQNVRLMGFDNAHAIEGNNKVYDHWHRHSKDEGRAYEYTTAAELLADFWEEVERIHAELHWRK